MDNQRSQLQTSQRRVAELEQLLKEKEQHVIHLTEMYRIKDHELAAVRSEYGKKLDEDHRTNSTKLDEPDRSQLSI